MQFKSPGATIAMGSVVAIRPKGKLIIGNSTEMKTVPSLATGSGSIDLDTSMRNRLSQHSYLLDMNITLLSVYDGPNYHKNDHSTKWMTKCEEFSEASTFQPRRYVGVFQIAALI